MAGEFISVHQADFDKAIEHFKQDIVSLRTGRANPAMVEGLMVEAYGTRMQLNGVASISTPDARTIQIEPWDTSVVKAVEKGIIESNLGFNPTVAGTVIRISMPPLTEENRRNLVRLLGEKAEEARKRIRSVRDEVRSDIADAEKAKEITEDDKYREQEQLDKVAAGYNERIKNISEEKEREIMTV
jgi:ribosome recycling factor